MLAHPATKLAAFVVSLAALVVATAAGSHPVPAGARLFAALHGAAGSAAGGGTTLPPEVTDLAHATPGALCGPGSNPETGRQGRVPSADYAGGRAAQGYTCNTELVGRSGITGGYQVHRYVDGSGRECAFYDSTLIYGKDVYKGAEPGVYAVDMSNPATPTRTAILKTPAMQSPHESLRLHAARGLLVADMGAPTTNPGFVDVYDVSQDCRTPQLRASVPLGIAGHEGGFSPDGRTYWVTTTAAPGIMAIDLTDPANPTIVWRSSQWASHGISISPDGNRAYLAAVADFVTTTATGSGALVILDVSDVQARATLPKVREISRLTWPEVSIPQNSLPVTIGGRRYLIQFDEFDSNVYLPEATDTVGGVHVIDIENEADPVIVSRIRLQVHQQEVRGTDQQDDPGYSRVGQGYAAHYCSVPRETDPGIVACSMIASGLRVFDIRNPAAPREVAYFNQPLVSSPDPGERGAYAMSSPAFAPERNEIWYSDVNSGFFVVRLTNGAWGA